VQGHVVAGGIVTETDKGCCGDDKSGNEPPKVAQIDAKHVQIWP